MSARGIESSRLLSSEELADFLKVPIATIHRWRCKGSAPKAVRVGRHLRFDMNDVREWMEERKG